MNRLVAGFLISFLIHGALLACFLCLQDQRMVSRLSTPIDLSILTCLTASKPGILSDHPGPVWNAIPDQGAAVSQLTEAFKQKPAKKTIEKAAGATETLPDQKKEEIPASPHKKTHPPAPRNTVKRPLKKTIPVSSSKPVLEQTGKRINTDPPTSVSAGASKVEGGESSDKPGKFARDGVIPAGGKKAPAITSASGPKKASSTKKGTRYLDVNDTEIRIRLNKNLYYPQLARRKGWCGRVMVAFTVLSDGRVKNITINKSSGIPLLDKCAVKTISMCAPFPKPTSAVRIVVPILYQLQKHS